MIYITTPFPVLIALVVFLIGPLWSEVNIWIWVCIYYWQDRFYEVTRRKA
jgi:hypothetical protein